MSKKSKNNSLPQISTHMIVKNEIENLPLLIEDLRQFSDEIIVVDTGSDDGTLEWLKENSDSVLKYYEFEWINNFSAARNFALSKVTKDWVFWCDADDRISEELIKIINNLKPTLNKNDFNVYTMSYQYTPTFVHHRNRLFKMTNTLRWECVCHECLICDDMCVCLFPENCKIIHQREHGKTERNIEIFDKYIAAGNTLNTRETFCFAHEINSLWDRKKEAEDYVMGAFFKEDAWNVLCWEAFVDVMSPTWIESPEKGQIGIAILNRYEELHGQLRGDVYYVRACLYDNIGDRVNSLKDCYNAINTVKVGIETYNENKYYSKILPAMSIYNSVTDEFTRGRMAEILKLYRDDLQAYNFLVENNLIEPTEEEKESMAVLNSIISSLQNCSTE